jgi:hypothetical protein
MMTEMRFALVICMGGYQNAARLGREPDAAEPRGR